MRRAPGAPRGRGADRRPHPRPSGRRPRRPGARPCRRPPGAGRPPANRERVLVAAAATRVVWPTASRLIGDGKFQGRAADIGFLPPSAEAIQRMSRTDRARSPSPPATPVPPRSLREYAVPVGYAGRMRTPKATPVATLCERGALLQGDRGDRLGAEAALISTSSGTPPGCPPAPCAARRTGASSPAASPGCAGRPAACPRGP